MKKLLYSLHVSWIVIILELNPSPLPAAVLYFLLQVSFLVDEGVCPVLLQLLSCALCGSRVLAALAASTASSSSSSSSSAPVASSSGQATAQSKSSTKKSKKEEKEKEKEGKRPGRYILVSPGAQGLLSSEVSFILTSRGPKTQMSSGLYFWYNFQLHGRWHLKNSVSSHLRRLIGKVKVDNILTRPTFFFCEIITIVLWLVCQCEMKRVL